MPAPPVWELRTVLSWTCLELDAASNNGVDQIRALRDEAAYTPAAVRKRVYIVDEVHMLSTAAFNALLKILEEPPAHLMFILATTELHKVPATIKSRCQQFAFKRISPKALAGRLDYVARQEGIPLSTPAAELLARLADGGLRDGLSLLDQCERGRGRAQRNRCFGRFGIGGKSSEPPNFWTVWPGRTPPARWRRWMAFIGMVRTWGRCWESLRHWSGIF